MKFFDYIKIALKNIWRQRVRSSLTIVSIVIGSLAVISVLSLVFGAQKVFMDTLQAEGSFTHVMVTPNQENLSGGGGPFGGGGQEVSDSQKKIDDALIQKIKTINYVTDVNPAVRIWNLESYKAKGGNGKKFRADVEASVPGKATEKKIIAGRDFTKEDGNRKVIIGVNLLESLGYKDPQDAVGKTIIFTTKKGYQGEGAQLPDFNSDNKESWDKLQEQATELEAEIIGITSPPGPGSNGSVFITMNWARKIMSWPNMKEDPVKMEAYKTRMETSGIRNWDMRNCQDCRTLTYESEIDRQGYHMAYVQVNNPDNTKAVSEEIKKLGVGTITAEDMLKMFTQVISIIAAVLGAIGAISLGVATIGIVNTMVMATMERTREIGVMRACGATRKIIRRLFMFEAAVLGFLGGTIGILTGIGVSKIANYYINRMLASQNMSAENVISLPLWLIVATLGITTFLGLISGLYPAFRAARLDPVEALRYE
ncbi:MAG: ABC transporter permease [Patescibacteria group bacterium]|nr:ABC transporter permease [Patescibacteria group bacterium]